MWELSHKFYRVKKTNKRTGKESNKFEIVTGNKQLHWVLKQKRKKMIEDIFFRLAKLEKIPKLEKIKVSYEIIFPDCRERDTDNFEWIKKGINDGIKIQCLPFTTIFSKYNKVLIPMVFYFDDTKHLIDGGLIISNAPENDFIEIKIKVEEI